MSTNTLTRIKTTKKAKGMRMLAEPCEGVEGSRLGGVEDRLEDWEVKTISRSVLCWMDCGVEDKISGCWVVS